MLYKKWHKRHKMPVKMTVTLAQKSESAESQQTHAQQQKPLREFVKCKKKTSCVKLMCSNDIMVKIISKHFQNRRQKEEPQF